jgi:hypothetical protein
MLWKSSDLASHTLVAVSQLPIDDFSNINKEHVGAVKLGSE